MESEPANNQSIPHRPKNKKGITKPQYQNLNPFKAEEKKYKSYYGQQTDYSDLLQPKEADYRNVDGFQVYELPFPKGAIYVRQFNDPVTCVQIGLFGLNVFCNRPYRTNIDDREQLYLDKNESEGEAYENRIPIQKEEQQTEEVYKNKDQGYYFNDKIRWANVGHQYDWTLRKYPDKKTPIHHSIQSLSQRANDLFNKIQGTPNCTYHPESAIINYYGVKDYMTGHLDDAEVDQQSPIYSFSVGLSCIFVIGGPTRDSKPSAIKLNSGDLFIMSGQSRKCFHGVPRVIDQSFQLQEAQREQLREHNRYEFLDQQWLNQPKEVLEYFGKHRININVRQVYPQE